MGVNQSFEEHSSVVLLKNTNNNAAIFRFGEFVLIKPTIKLAFAGLLTATVQALFTCLSNTKRTRQGEPRKVPQSHQHSRELAGHIILDKEAWSNWGR